jgi:hypothetical protein
MTRPEVVADLLTSTGLPITISGGEPFEQPVALEQVLHQIRDRNEHVHIIVYTGYRIEELLETRDPAILHSLTLIDVLVDGPYVHAQDHPGMQYRGSSNQRVIDLPATFRLPSGMILSRHPVELDWDQPELILMEDGNLIGASPIVDAFSDIGTISQTRRCGEVSSRSDARWLKNGETSQDTQTYIKCPALGV